MPKQKYAYKFIYASNQTKPKQTKTNQIVANRTESSWVESSWVVWRLRQSRTQIWRLCHILLCMTNIVCLCVCVRAIEYCLYGSLWSLVSDGLWFSFWFELWNLDSVCSSARPCVRLSVCPSVHLSAGGVPINCPNVQTSFVMRITKIEANHFANRILISNVSDSAVIRWIYTMEVEIQDSGFCLRLGNWVYRSPTIYDNFCVFAASGVWNYAMPLLIYWRAKWELVVLEAGDDIKQLPTNI